MLSASQTNTHDSTLTCARFRQIDVPLSPIRDEQFVIISRLFVIVGWLNFKTFVIHSLFTNIQGRALSLSLSHTQKEQHS